MRLKNKVCIVTGASKGIGLACAERYAQEGAKVVMCARSADIGEQNAEKIRQAGGDAIFIQCDVSKKADVQRVVDEAVAHYGRIDVVLNNAGVNHRAPFLETTEEDWEWVMNVDVKGTFLMGQAVARQMVKQGEGGSIINMSSVMAVLALAEQVPYCAAKGAVNQLTKAMAISLGDKQIRVNAIGPGPIVTELMQKVVSNKDKSEELLRRMPLARIGGTGEVAGVAVFLACEDSSFVTGQCVYCDGGRMIQGFPRNMEA